jgi:hypothetical protein
MNAKFRPVFVALAAAVVGLHLMASANAVCPVCTVAVGTGVGLSRWLGVDDAVTGLWLGGLTVSMIIWTLHWMESRNIHFKGRGLVTTIVYYLLLLAPLHYGNFLGHPHNAFHGVDKLLLGIGAGSLAFFAGAWWYERIKEKHGGHANFPFQKVVLPVSPLLVLSVIFFFLTKRV